MSKLAETARRALTAAGFETDRGMCNRWVRQVVQATFGDRYDELFYCPAVETGGRLRVAGLAVEGAPKPGDLLVKTRGSGGFGHIGIYLGNKQVAENSSVHWHRRKQAGQTPDARGIRSLAAYNQGVPYTVCGRLPADQEPPLWTLLLSGKDIARMPVHGGVALCPVREWATALGLEVDYDGERARVLIGGREVPSGVTMIDDRAYLPVRTLALFHGLSLVVGQREVRVSKAA